MDNFLPSDYQVPQTKGNYMKFEEGENKIRILTSPIVGWEYWNEDEKGVERPIRKKLTEKLVLAEIQKPEKVRHFWAMVVWNYQDKKIQILEITQKTLQRSLKALANDEDWGTPLNYDVVITREGKDLNTKYELQPKPAKELSKEIKDIFEKTSINLNALFTGEDPFSNIEKVEANEL